jgi:RimJ/RimL family protein N-acetyltransferase
VPAFKHFQKIWSEHGARAAGIPVVDRIGARLCGLTVAHVIWLTLENAKLPAALLGYAPRSRPHSADARAAIEAAASEWIGWSFRFLTADELLAFAQSPENQLDAAFVHERTQRGDRCFGALDGDRLAAYGWYALHEIQPEHCFGFGMRYSASTAYMYKGFTKPEYRSRRLHGATMGLALHHLGLDGITALVSTVDWTNQASLKSCWRLGYEPLGCVVSVRKGGQGGRRLLRVPRRAIARNVRFFIDDVTTANTARSQAKSEVTSSR